jgi:leader peptidase (prepilin peptidase)/N-methyltransferase
VELLTGVLFLVTAWTLLPPGALRDPLSAGSAWLTFGVMAVVVSSLVALSLIDVDYRILPDEITKPGILLGPVLAFLAPSMQHGRFLVTVGEDLGTWGPRLSALASGVVGAVSAAAILWLIGWLGAKAFRKEAMGFGDVKMMAAMGGCLGAWALLSLVVAAFSGAAVGLAVRLVSKGRYIPFGPFLALGMWTVMLWGPALLRAYLGK